MTEGLVTAAARYHAVLNRKGLSNGMLYLAGSLLSWLNSSSGLPHYSFACCIQGWKRNCHSKGRQYYLAVIIYIYLFLWVWVFLIHISHFPILLCHFSIGILFLVGLHQIFIILYVIITFSKCTVSSLIMSHSYSIEVRAQSLGPGTLVSANSGTY